MSIHSHTSDQASRVIKELSQGLGNRRSSRNTTAAAGQIDRVSNPTLNSNQFQDFETESSGFSEDVLMSTRQGFDDFEEQSRYLPDVPIRSSARKLGFYSFKPQEPEVRLNTSFVDGHFSDFDGETPPLDDALQDSIEIARGPRRSAKSTPVRGNISDDFSKDFLFSMAKNSPQSLSNTPLSRPRVTPRKATDNDAKLRKDAQIRSASGAVVDNNENSVKKSTKTQDRGLSGRQTLERRKSTLAQMQARVSSDEDSILEDRPPTVTFTAKNTRFGGAAGSNSRQVSASSQFNTKQPTSNQTPRKNNTQQSVHTPGNPTQQSFMLPDLPDLTELVSGVFKDGTPVFSRSSKARSRFMTNRNPSRSDNSKPNHVPLGNVSLPSDEKAIFAALQLLQDKVAQLEKEKEEAEQRIEEQENYIIQISAEQKAREKIRRADSALGSTDSEKNKDDWKVQKTRLETSVGTLRAQLDRADRKVSVADIATKRVTTERDGLVTQLGVAYYNLEELKGEQEALRAENTTLRNEVDEVRQTNDSLVTENDELRAQIVQLQEENQKLRRRTDRKEAAFQVETQALQTEIEELRVGYDMASHKLANIKNPAVKNTAQIAEQTKLKSENTRLRDQVASLKADREEKSQKFASAEAELLQALRERDEATDMLHDQTHGVTVELEVDNNILREQIADLQAQLESQQEAWLEMEARLRQRLERSKSHSRRVTSTNTRDTNNESTGVEPTGQKDLRTRRIVSERYDNTSGNTKTERTTRSGFESTRRTAAESSRPQRVVSAPSVKPRIATVESAESTTDLSIGHTSTRKSKYYMHGANGNDTPAKEEKDITLLSPLKPDFVSALRKRLEEERLSGRSKFSLKDLETESQPQHTARSFVSIKERTTETIPRKSSLRNISAKIFPQEEEVTSKTNTTKHAPTIEITGHSQSKQDTERFTHSRSAYRRRSAPVETTSAFILPDITVRVPNGLGGIEPELLAAHKGVNHDAKKCTICFAACDGKHGNDGKTGTFKIPMPVPVSSRMPDDVDATMRPAQDPAVALATVIKQLEDEVAHYKIELHIYEQILQKTDASLAKKKRKELQNRIDHLIKLIDTRSDQIYDLYDVVEGQQNLTSQEVEDTLQSIGIDLDILDEIRHGKKVIIDETEQPRSKRDLTQEPTEELPWEGLSDTESLPDF